MTSTRPRNVVNDALAPTEAPLEPGNVRPARTALSRLTDDEFLVRLRQAEGNRRRLARGLGVSEAAIRKRLARVSVQDLEPQEAVVAIVNHLAQPAPEEGLRVMAMLAESNRIAQAVLRDIQDDVGRRNGKIRIFERDTLLKISARQEQLAKTYVEIQTKFYAAKKVEAVLRAILAEVAQEMPEVQERVARRLLGLGVLSEFLDGS